MQMKLPFLDSPHFNAEIWESLDNAQRSVVLDRLARLIAKTVEPEPQRAEADNE